MPALFSTENLAALVTLTAMEIVLGIDNIVFIAILTGRLDPSRRDAVRRAGLLLAMAMRIALLLAISWIMGLTAPLLTIAGRALSGRDIILLLGGLFLIAKATYEIHHRIEGPHDQTSGAGAPPPRVGAVLVQIILLDVVFSLDSVITAVGMAGHLGVMITAVAASVGVMMVFAGSISRFIERHPTMKVLALSFLLLIGVMLVADGVGQHMPRGYVYFAMAFSLGVEMLNIRSGARGRPTTERRGA